MNGMNATPPPSRQPSYGRPGTAGSAGGRQYRTGAPAHAGNQSVREVHSTATAADSAPHAGTSVAVDTSFAIDIELHGEIAVLAIAGEVDFRCGRVLRKAIEGLLAQGVANLVVDLSGATFFSEAGLAVLAWTSAAIAEHEGVGTGGLAVVATEPTIRRRIQLSGLDTVFPTCLTLQQARMSLWSRTRRSSCHGVNHHQARIACPPMPFPAANSGMAAPSSTTKLCRSTGATMDSRPAPGAFVDRVGAKGP